MRIAVVVSLTVVTTLALAGCGSASSSATASTPPPTRTSVPTASHSSTPALPSTSPSASPSASQSPRRKQPVSKVLVVMEENHSLAEMRSGMPYLAGLSNRYGYATDWHAEGHPSEPNYLAIAGGSTFGVTNDDPPSHNARLVGRASSVFSQALATGHTAATYAEAMPHSCATTDHGQYAVRHNPWTFFAADRSACRRHDRSTARFAADARKDRLPDVGFLIPDLVHDAHDGTLAAADRWLRGTLAPVLASHDFTSGRLVVVVTADEDDRHHGNVVLTSVLTPHLSHVVVRRRLDHYSLTRFIDGVLGVPDLRNARHARDLAAAFGL